MALLAAEAHAGNFNPRSPHGERHGGGVLLVSLEIFQSTLPARGATIPPLPMHKQQLIFQSTLPARGATQDMYGAVAPEGAFQSTLPARGATASIRFLVGGTVNISIHAPRTGSDEAVRAWNNDERNFNPRSPHGERLCRRLPAPRGQYFNPRSPHGERRSGENRFHGFAAFQSTLPARGAT